MYETVRDTLRAMNESAVMWAIFTLAVAVVGAVSGFWALLLIALLAAFQWGYRAASEIYENGIMCAECGDRLDVEEDPRTAL